MNFLSLACPAGTNEFGTSWSGKCLLNPDLPPSANDTDDLIGVPRATAYRTWNYAKAWLRTKVGAAADGSS